MKENIYTIPLNEAFESGCECPLCHIEKKNEEEAVSYALGAAMMEPDFRIESNEKGFCRNHYRMLFKKPNKLSLALILETHLLSISKSFESLDGDFNALSSEKKKLFKSSPKNETIHDWFSENQSSCVICDKINNTKKRYIEVLFHMWKNDENFKKKLYDSKGFCLYHFKDLVDSSQEFLNKNERADFLKIIYKKEKDELAAIREDTHKFTLKFDYRNRDMELGSAVDAPKRAIEKLSGFICDTEDE